MEASIITDLEEEIKLKQEELSQLKYKDVYDAQDAYEAAQVVYKEAENSMVKAARTLSQVRVNSGLTRSTVLTRAFRL
jgi:hypothetical protein|tara:strand:+ start:137 stop:370 length:234 start_codon:yes stop_codon:yes gene_type:complete